MFDLDLVMNTEKGIEKLLSDIKISNMITICENDVVAQFGRQEIGKLGYAHDKGAMMSSHERLPNLAIVHVIQLTKTP